MALDPFMLLLVVGRLRFQDNVISIKQLQHETYVPTCE